MDGQQSTVNGYLTDNGERIRIMRPDILDQIKAICCRYDVDALYVFGSRGEEIAEYVCGEGEMATEKESDVDIGVLPAKDSPLSARDRVRLAMDLEDLLRVPRVDLVILTEISPFLALEIISGELLYSVDLDQTSEYELHIMRKAGDLAHFERRRRDQILREGTS